MPTHGPFIVNLGDGGEEERSRRHAERLRLRERYLRHLVESAGVDEAAAARVMTALFDHQCRDGTECLCGCHPRLDALHDDGFDCPCGWDDARRAEQARRWTELWDGPEAATLREQHNAEEQQIAHWISSQTDVQATRTTSYAPEQWEGVVDGHSFYFRERHGTWRLELDMEPSGHTAERLVEVTGNGELVTEPVPIMQGEVIAEGLDSQLGPTPLDHLDFIVRTIRDHLWARECDHSGALFFCPKCGRRMTAPS